MGSVGGPKKFAERMEGREERASSGSCMARRFCVPVKVEGRRVEARDLEDGGGRRGREDCGP